MAKVTYTKEQKQAINLRGTSLLVSAAAGSGKTTVMIERVVNLISKKQVPIKNFLIISFTKASASDMKNKLISKLSEVEPTPFILEQLDDILTSDVSNLHSFCARLLKSYFYEVGLDPTFVVLDDDEAGVLKEKALEKLIRQKSASKDPVFFELVDIFAKKRKVEKLKEAILKVYEFLCSIVNKDAWKKMTLLSLYNDDIEHNGAAKILNNHAKNERKRLEKKLGEFMKRDYVKDEPKLIAYLQSIDTYIKQVNLGSTFMENAQRLKEMPNIMRKPTLDEGKEFVVEEAVALKKQITDSYDKLKEYFNIDNLDNIHDALSLTKDRVQKLFDLTSEFESEYDALKKEKGGLDFNDLEKYTLEVLKSKVILDEIKKKYKYILVDEYQDINGVQEEIISLLSKANNRFMVGDVKQSIYRFRLCDPSIFLEKYKHYFGEDGGKLILLNANFRSKKPILDFVNAVFDRTMTEKFGGVNYKKEARLVAGGDNKKDKEKRVKILFADSKIDKVLKENLDVYSVKDDFGSEQESQIGGEAEGLMLFHEISDLRAHYKIYDKNLKRERNIRYSDITILTQSRNGYLAKIIDTLEQQGVPVSSDAEGDCLEDEYVYGLNAFLSVVDNYKDDNNLFSCLFSKLFGFSGDELASIKIAGSGAYFHECVKSAMSSDTLDEDIKAKLNSFFELYSEVREKSKYLCAKELADIVLERQSAFVKMSFDSQAEKKKQKMRKYLTYLEEKRLKEYLEESRENGMKCEPAHTHGAVKVMTIHKSKGLEFGVVFVVMANKNFNLDSVKGDYIISKDLGLGLDYFDRTARYKTPTISKQAVKLVETRKLLEEQQRLLYVALTRATDYLFVSACGDYDKIKSEFPVSPMCFMDFLGDMVKEHEKYSSLNFDVEVLNAEDLIKNKVVPEKRQVLLNDDDKELSNNMKDVLFKKYEYDKSVFVPVKTAVTSLVNEQSEEESHVLFSEGEGSSAKKGTIMHKFMEKLSLKESSVEELKKRLEELVEGGVFSRDDAKLIDLDGVQKLLKNQEFVGLVSGAEKIYKEKEFYMLVGASEYFGGCDGDGVVVQGIVDLCLKNSGGLAIVDYKTGTLNESAVEKYKKQIELYASAMQKSMNLPVTKKYIASLKTGELICV